MYIYIYYICMYIYMHYIYMYTVCRCCGDFTCYPTGMDIRKKEGYAPSLHEGLHHVVYKLV